MQDDNGASDVLLRGGYMAKAGGRRDQSSGENTPRQLQAMFERAAPHWPIPSEEIIDRCAFLHTSTWAVRWTTPETRPRRAWDTVERDVRAALKILQAQLPKMIEVHRKLVGVPPIGPAHHAALLLLNDMLPVALAALGPDLHRGKRSEDWHAAAALIAEEAIEAWRLAGHTKNIGTNPTSPLVSFVHEFLARAGIDKDHATIAKALKGATLGKTRPN
jgi:hypothetical protein